MLKAYNSGALSLSLYCLISAEAAACGHRQPAEPSTTKAQRLQGPRTEDKPKTEEKKTEKEFEWDIGRAGMSAQTSSHVRWVILTGVKKDPASFSDMHEDISAH